MTHIVALKFRDWDLHNREAIIQSEMHFIIDHRKFLPRDCRLTTVLGVPAYISQKKRDSWSIATLYHFLSNCRYWRKQPSWVEQLHGLILAWPLSGRICLQVYCLCKTWSTFLFLHSTKPLTTPLKLLTTMYNITHYLWVCIYLILQYFVTLQNAGFGSNLIEKKQKLLSNISSALQNTIKQFKARHNCFMYIYIHVTFDVLAGAKRKEGKRIVDNHNSRSLGRKSWTRNQRISSFQSWCIQCSDSSTFHQLMLVIRGYNIYFTYRS